MCWKTAMYLSEWLWNDPTAHTLRMLITHDPDHAAIYRRALQMIEEGRA